MAQYPRPTGNTGTFNNQSFVSPDTGGLTIDEAKQYFVTFPNTQSPSTIIADNFNTTGSLNVGGDSQFGGDVTFIGGVSIAGGITFEDDVEVTGTTTLDDNLLCLTTATVTDLLTCEGGIDITTIGDGITFPDNTTQTTAFIEANYAQLNTDNTFLPTFTQTFSGPVNLNDVTNGVTQLSGNNSTLLATTAFVQDAVQVAGVQVTDSPLLWSGANTNQYNAGTGSTLTYTYPYGLSQLYNLSGGNEEFSLVANNGNAGPEDNAFRIYCIPGNQTGTQISALTPQLILSNNGTAMFVKDGINVNAGNIVGIGALAGVAGNISCNSNLLIGAGNNINMQTNTITNCSALNGSSGGTLLLGTQQPTYITITAGSLTAGSSLGINSTNGTCIFNYYTANNLSLNMTGTVQTFQIQNDGVSIMEFSPTSAINAYQNLGMNGKDISMLGGDILGCTSITNVTGVSYVTTNTPPDNSIPTAIATTQYVANNAPVYLQSSFTNIWAGTSSISPTTVNVITTRIVSTNIVSFNNVNVIVNSNAGIGNTMVAQFQFNTNPWSTYPPPSGAATSISVYCNTNGATYSCQTAWFTSPPVLAIGYPAGGPTSPCQFTVNLSSFGAFAG